MKKLVAVCAFFFSVAFVNAQTDDSRIEFDYYPESNVYFNTKSHAYLYFDSAAKKWQTVSELPARYSVNDKSEKKKLYSDSPDIWTKNFNHVKMFGNKNAATKPKQ
ncbi:MAG: hypothetical protein ABIN94_15155 [Ferruginibacter sp.]